MFRLIIKNLWHRRLRNGWLLAELILVTIVSWVILDPVVVDTYDMNRPLGYDADRICLIGISELSKEARGYDPDRKWGNIEDLTTLLNRVRQHPQIESATLLRNEVYFNASSDLNRAFTIDDSIDLQVNQTWFEPNCDFFATYGIKSIEGAPSAEELDRMSYGPSDIVITRSVAKAMFPEGDAIGKEIETKDYDSGSDQFKVVGIVEDIRPKSYSRNTMSMIVLTPEYEQIGSPHLLIRIRPGVDIDNFVAYFRPWMRKNLKIGNMSCRTIEPYVKRNADVEYQVGGNEITLKKILALFFLINLALGVTGTFWLQTRTRCQDVGIMRSFGATPPRIRAMLMAEGALLTVTAWFTGCIIYLQWAIHEGLSNGRDIQWPSPFDTGWVCSFWPHFISVSLIVLVLILMVVMLGVWLPARKLSRTNPVDVLHEN